MYVYIHIYIYRHICIYTCICIFIYAWISSWFCHANRLTICSQGSYEYCSHEVRLSQGLSERMWLCGWRRWSTAQSLDFCYSCCCCRSCCGLCQELHSKECSEWMKNKLVSVFIEFQEKQDYKEYLPTQHTKAIKSF